MKAKITRYNNKCRWQLVTTTKLTEWRNSNTYYAKQMLENQKTINENELSKYLKGD